MGWTRGSIWGKWLGRFLCDSQGNGGSVREDLKPIRTEVDYEHALAEVEHLWGAKSGTPDGDRLDRLATLIDAYEAEHDPMDPPGPSEAMRFRMEQ